MPAQVNSRPGHQSCDGQRGEPSADGPNAPEASSVESERRMERYLRPTIDQSTCGEDYAGDHTDAESLWLAAEPDTERHRSPRQEDVETRPPLPFRNVKVIESPCLDAEENADRDGDEKNRHTNRRARITAAYDGESTNRRGNDDERMPDDRKIARQAVDWIRGSWC